MQITTRDAVGPGRSLLGEIFRDDARQMLAAALQAEVATHIEQFADQVGENRHRLVVRNGYPLERDVLTATGANVKGSSAILLAYLHGLSSSDFGPELDPDLSGTDFVYMWVDGASTSRFDSSRRSCACS